MMPTYRQYYFQLRNCKEYHFTDTIIYSLFSHVSNMDKSMVVQHFDDEILKYSELEILTKRITDGEPYQYVLGYTYFLGNKFYVNKNVLIPRQETEQLVIETVEFISNNYSKKIEVLDMCSGSGCIGISIAKKTGANVDMVDISEEANKVAKENNILNKTNCNIFKSDLFTQLNIKEYDVILSNPPYIKDESSVDKSTLINEPNIALFAKPQTRFYEEIMKNCSDFLANDGFLALEIEENMEEELVKLINKYLPLSSFVFKKDIYNKTRFLYIRKKVL